ncbi:FAD-dependent oxidoreductase [Chlorogloea sp. CCALA 695]|uniref:FAD-dependent oxidoreductase n=1 Tax=Chlorogloea sp. CCALA 695 TaxID=2107693 RepID=UPI000D049312|nr:FAD-dependent oxidoreductase [Chlorogloea sp. CCALA 695]PSB32347.1 FAD-dependent oxidoreductase [Chlorogloea sp. CCALA 695]
MQNELISCDVLVVGSGTGGTSAAIQAARSGAKTILVSEFEWLGGMLTSAGVAAPDGNELQAFQTGLWGEFLQQLQQKQIGGLNNSWVSFFSYNPRLGAEIFADWVKELPLLQWIAGSVPLEVIKNGNAITGVRFADFTVKAKITLDATELGDLLALAEIPYRWGWELQAQWGEVSAPIAENELTKTYPIQAPTWVVIMQEFESAIAPKIPAPPNYNPTKYTDAWADYGQTEFLNYGRLPGNLFMINWPKHGNDYAEDVKRLIESETSQQQFLQQSLWHTQGFAHFIQSQFGRKYGLATNIFSVNGGAYAIHPYYRESRRLVGINTIIEQDILPISGGNVAQLQPESVAIGNYANDHHYPGVDFPLQSKSIRWGGRWTGTPFTIPYSCLVPVETDGLLACEKNISVSHVANGATRLQPVVMNIGQAAGMAAALCVELGCQPRDLPISKLQNALLQAKTSIIPLFNLPPNHPDWLYWQRYYLEHLEAYPISGNCPCNQSPLSPLAPDSRIFEGIFNRRSDQDYTLTLTESMQTWQLVTMRSHINEQLQICPDNQPLKVWGTLNHSGKWLLVEDLTLFMTRK